MRKDENQKGLTIAGTQFSFYNRSVHVNARATFHQFNSPVYIDTVPDTSQPDGTRKEECSSTSRCHSIYVEEDSPDDSFSSRTLLRFHSLRK